MTGPKQQIDEQAAMEAIAKAYEAEGMAMSEHLGAQVAAEMFKPEEPDAPASPGPMATPLPVYDVPPRIVDHGGKAASTPVGDLRARIDMLTAAHVKVYRDGPLEIHFDVEAHADAKHRALLGDPATTRERF